MPAPPAAQKQPGSHGLGAAESRGRVRESRGRARLAGGRGTADPGKQAAGGTTARARGDGRLWAASPGARPPQEGVCFHSAAAPGWPQVEDLDTKAYGDSCWPLGALWNPDYSEAEPG